MLRRRDLLAITAMTPIAAALSGSAVGDDSASKLDAGLASTKRLLLLMDTDKNGKVSKQEFMAFMDAEFERLDTNHDGELDVKELRQLQVRPLSPHR